MAYTIAGIVFTYLFPLGSTLAFCFYQKHQFKDTKVVRDVKWKTFAVIIRILPFAWAYLAQYFPAHITDYFLSGVLCMIGYIMGINTIALGLSNIWYIGLSNELDKILGQWQWYILGALLIIASLLRIFLHLNF